MDNSEEELALGGGPPEGALIADAGALPLADASVDGVFCSNLLEHTPDAAPVIAEIERVLKPGGWAYVSWTNWYSPWGGHDMTPYQYLGPTRGPRLYERRHGKPRKNAYGDGLWACHIGPTLRLVRARRPAGDRACRAALLAVGGAGLPRPRAARARHMELRDPNAAAVTDRRAHARTGTRRSRGWSRR